MKYVDARMLTQVFIVSLMLGWTLRELARVAIELLKIAVKVFDLPPRLQKSKKPARCLTTKRISSTIVEILRVL